MKELIERLSNRVDRAIEENGQYWTGVVIYIQAQDVNALLEHIQSLEFQLQEIKK